MSYELHPLCTHVVYAIYFSDHRVKVGVTADFAKRRSYYQQEAARNRSVCATWWATAPAPKYYALLIEKHFCRANRDLSMSGHREWFEGDSTFYGSVIEALVDLRKRVAKRIGENDADIDFRGQWGYDRNLLKKSEAIHAH